MNERQKLMDKKYPDKQMLCPYVLMTPLGSLPIGALNNVANVLGEFSIAPILTYAGIYILPILNR